jgi:mannosyltransferase OCH1-like enzyme
MTIPKIIHHIWMGKNNIPIENLKLADTVRKKNPDFEYILWKDDDVDNLMKNFFPEYYEKFNELPRLIMKIDMFRYFLMYKYGGLYTDMDYLMFKPFDLLEKKIVIPENRNKDNNNNITMLGNSIFASVPGNSFWKTLIDTLFVIDRKNLPSHGKDNVINSTGPIFVYNMYKKFENKDDIYVPDRMLFHPPYKKDYQYIKNLEKNGCYGIHMCSGLWLDDKL